MIPVLNVISGESGVDFTGGATLGYCPNYLAEKTSAEIFIVLRAGTDPNAGANNLWDMGVSDTSTAYPDGTGHIIDDWGSTTSHDVGDPIQPLTQLALYNVRSTPSEWTAYLDNVQLFTTPTNTVKFPEELRIGGGIIVSEIAIYSPALSETDRLKVANAMGARFGLSWATAPSGGGVTEPGTDPDNVIIGGPPPAPPPVPPPTTSVLRPFGISLFREDWSHFGEAPFNAYETTYATSAELIDWLSKASGAPAPPVSGITIAPGESWQGKVNANPEGTAFRILAGTHVGATVVPKTGMQFVGDAGAILDGQNVTPFFLHVGPTVLNVKLKNLTITRYNPGFTSSVLEIGTASSDTQASYPTGWVLEDLVISYSETGTGLFMGNNTICRRCNIHHNDVQNVVAKGLNGLIEDSEIAFGNYRQRNDWQFTGGGSKFVLTDGFTVRRTNAHDNWGPGLWTDEGNIRTTYDANTTTNNAGPGIMHEISYDALIQNNIVTGNGFFFSGGNWQGGGILISSSGGTVGHTILVKGNTLANNQADIVSYSQSRGVGPFGTREVRNVRYESNNVTSCGTVASTFFGSDNSLDYSTRNVSANFNTYRVNGGHNAWGFADASRTFAQWQGYGFDLGGSTSAITCPPAPASFITIAPGENWQAKVDANPTGTVFRVLAGTHVRATVIPKTGDQFIGDPGAIMDGQNVTTYAFRSSGGNPDNVVIRGIRVTNYNPPQQQAAIWPVGPNTSGWLVENCEIDHNANIGLFMSSPMTARGNNIHHNGTMGVGGGGGGGMGMVFENNEVAYNHFPASVPDPFLEVGGSKFVGTNGAIIRGNNFHHNNGNGIWLDIDNINYLIENNTTDDNGASGIVVEIGYAGVIRNNISRRNGHTGTDGLGPAPWIIGISGISIESSPNIEVYGNTVEDNRAGILGSQQNRSGDLPIYPGTNYGPHLLKNLNVHDNIVRNSTLYQAGLGGDTADLIFGLTFNNRFVNNDYQGNCGSALWSWAPAPQSFVSWQGQGQDVTGSCT